MLGAGARAPTVALPDAGTGQTRTAPAPEGPTVLVFFKTTCPVCRMTAPKVQALADAGVRVVAVGEDPPEALRRYAKECDLRVPTVREPAPYATSTAFGLHTVPSLFLVDADGTVLDATASWDRDAWNRLAERAGVGAISYESDGLPPQRPG